MFQLARMFALAVMHSHSYYQQRQNRKKTNTFLIWGKFLMAFCFPLCISDMHNPFCSITCIYDVTSFKLPPVKTNGLVYRGEIFINV